MTDEFGQREKSWRYSILTKNSDDIYLSALIMKIYIVGLFNSESNQLSDYANIEEFITFLKNLMEAYTQ